MALSAGLEAAEATRRPTWRTLYHALQQVEGEVPLASLVGSLRERLPELQRAWQPPRTDDGVRQTGAADGREGAAAADALAATSKQLAVFGGVDESVAAELVAARSDHDLVSLVDEVFRERLDLIRCCCSVFRSIHDSINLEIVPLLLEDEGFVNHVIAGAVARTEIVFPAPVREDSRWTYIWTRQCLLEQYALLETIFVLFYDHVPVTPNRTDAWFTAVRDTGVFAAIVNQIMHDDLTHLLQRVQALVAMICIQILSVDRGLEDGLNKDHLFFASSQSVSRIHRILMDLTESPLREGVGSPIFLAWSFFLTRNFVSAANLSSGLAETWNSICTVPDPDNERDSILIAVHTYMATVALSADPLKILCESVSLLSSDQNILGYKIILQGYLFDSINYLSFSDSQAQLFSVLHADEPILAQRFWAQFELGSNPFKLLSSASFRFPYEFSLLLKMLHSVLCPTTSQCVYDFLSNLETYTQALPGGFTAYDRPLSDDHFVDICLTKPLQLFMPRTVDGSGDITMEEGTEGKVISQSQPLIVAWLFNWNGWFLLARVLETAASSRGLRNVDAVIDIVALLSSMLGSEPNDKTGDICIQTVNDCLAPNANIFTIVADIMELNAHTLINKVLMIKESKCPVQCLTCVTQCIRFFSRGFKYAPEEVVRQVCRAKIFMSFKAANQYILMQKPDAAYSLSTEFIEFSSACLQQALQSCNPTLKQTPQSISNLLLWTVKMCDMIAADTVQDVNTRTQLRMIAAAKAYHLFYRILYYYNVLEDPAILHHIKPAVEYLVDVFKHDEPSHNLLVVVSYAVALFEDIGADDASLSAACQWADASIMLLKLLLQIAPSETIRFGYATLLSHSFADLWKLAINLPNLAGSISKLSTLLLKFLEGPHISFLAQIPAGERADFYVGCKNIMSPMTSLTVKSHVWHFFAAVLKSTQQRGLAILILTGESSIISKPLGKLFFQALDLVMEFKDSSFETIDQALYLNSVLKFLVAAFDFWSTIIKRHLSSANLAELVKSLHEILRFGLVDDTSTKAESTLIACGRVNCSKHAAQLLATILFLSRHRKDDQPSQKIVESCIKIITYKDVILQFFNVKNYRASLHGNLQRNFHKRWGIQLDKFRRSSRIEFGEYGSDYTYTRELLGAILGNSHAWVSYCAEIEQANLNLSIFDAHRSRIESIGILTASLIGIQPSSEVYDFLVEATRKCLQANVSESGMVSMLFNELCHRSRLANYIVLHLTEQMKNSLYCTLITETIEAVTTPSISIVDAITCHDLRYHQPLLHLLFTLISRRRKTEKLNLQLVTALGDDFVRFLCKAAETLFTHLPGEDIRQEDCELFQVMNAIVSELFTFKTDAIHTQLSICVIETGLIKTALGLFAWSDKTVLNAVPVLAELILEFLLSLSTMRLVAEQIAVEGMLDVIMESSLLSPLRTSGLDYVTDPTIYRAWTRGVLPLILRVRSHLGKRMIPGIIAFLRLYGPQVDLAFKKWIAPTKLTHDVVSETSLLVLLHKCVLKLGDHGIESPRVYEDCQANILSKVEYLLSHPLYLRSLIHPTTAEEARLSDTCESSDNQVKSEPFYDKVFKNLERLKSLL